jgi:hypothetical protein
MIRNLYSSVKASIVKQKGATYEPSREEIADNVFQLINMSMLNLHDAGYLTNNLWHIDDVMDNFECTEEQAMEVLNKVMTSSYVINAVFELINDECAAREYKSKFEE